MVSVIVAGDEIHQAQPHKTFVNYFLGAAFARRLRVRFVSISVQTFEYAVHCKAANVDFLVHIF